MIAKISEVWIIAECPHCNAPKTKWRHVVNNTLVNKTLRVLCENCDKPFDIDLKIYDNEVRFFDD